MTNRQRKWWFGLCALPFGLVGLLWGCGHVRTFCFNFGIPQYSYDVEVMKNHLQIERSYDCPKFTGLTAHTEPPAEFDQEFYDTWQRASEQNLSWGVYSCQIMYVVNDGTLALEPNDLVTPADFIAIPDWLMGAIALLPLLVFCGTALAGSLYRRNRKIAVVAEPPFLPRRPITPPPGP